MSILTVAWSMCAAANVMLALTHLFLWSKEHRDSVYLVSALMAAGAVGVTLAELSLLKAQTIEGFARGLIWSNVFVFLLLISMVWFIRLRFGTARRWLALLITAFWTVAIVLNFLSPASLVYTEIQELWHPTAFWRESFTLARGVQNPWVHISNVATLLIVIYVVDASLRVRRRGGKALFRVGMAMTFFIVTAGIHAPLVDAGIVATPYLVSFAFLAIVGAMTYEIVDSAVRSARYARKFELGEARWRHLLEDVQLLVVGLDTDGRITYANPCFARTAELHRADLVGAHYKELLSADEQVRFHEGVEAAFTGELPQLLESSLLTSRGELRKLIWSPVLYHRPDNASREILAVGADVTDKHAAEAARDVALEETRVALCEVDRLRGKLEEQVVYLSSEVRSVGRFETLVGESDAMHYVQRRIEQVAPLDTTVLIEGETGVGKELVARCIHAASERAARPVVTVDCSALPPSLVESELFGYERGAFTGATQRRRGRFELADGGTLFLDEVGELPLELQGKLLRALQEREILRLGSEAPIHVDTRVITATNRSLKRAVERGQFRDDLFYRLNVFPITVPPLRARKSDLPALVDYIVGRLARKQRKKITEIPASVMDELARYDWPGNVRELENLLERAVITSAEPSLRLAERLVPVAPLEFVPPTPVTQTLAEVERAHIERVLHDCHWRIAGPDGAAARLDMHPNTLRSRMLKHGLKRKTKIS